MEFPQLKPKEAASIIDALERRVVPRIGIQHLLVGRAKETDEIIRLLQRVAEGRSEIKFWIGDFGSGKSFMLQLIETLALRNNFVVSTVDFSPSRRLNASDGKARALYSEIIGKLITQTNQDGSALTAILDEWIETLLNEVASEHQVDFERLSAEKRYLVTDKIIDTAKKFRSAGSFEFGQAIAQYYEGYVSGDARLRESALRWLKGQYTAKSDSMRDLGIREIVTDSNYYDMLKNFAELINAIGYKGFVINLDEAINLYKLSMSQSRSNNYEQILTMYNDCTYEDRVKGLFINFGGTRKFLEDERRGLFSYEALRSRLSIGRFADSALIDLSQPVVYLKPLSQEDIFTLLSKLKLVFEQHYSVTIPCNQEHIARYMEGQLNRPGAAEFLTPRQVISEFLQILNLSRQNPEASINSLLDTMFGAQVAVDRDSEDHDNDGVEVL